MRATAMARVTSHHLAPAEKVLVDVRGHRNHRAGSPLVRICVSDIVFPTTVGSMAVYTRLAQGGGEESHDPEEFVDRDTFKHLVILE